MRGPGRKPFSTRFEEKYIPEPNTGCWLWIGAADRLGYGHFWDGKQVVAAYRWSYQRAHGSIPEGLTIDHLCRTPSCVNPDHMEPVTQAVNVLRGYSPAAQQARQQFCIRGHPLLGENLYIVPKTGWRQCKQCAHYRSTKYQRRIKA